MARKTKKSRPWQIKRHFIFVEVPVDRMPAGILIWAGAVWWPADTTKRILATSEEEIKVGTRYRQADTKVKAAGWMMEVVRYIPGRLIEYAIVNGPLEGTETVSVEERANGTRIDYQLKSRPRGLLQAWAWKYFYEKRHHRGIKLVLKGLRKYIMEQYEQQINA